jgi:archaellum component FlaC
MAKTNFDYLREFISGNDEANEFLNAIEGELSEASAEIKENDKLLEEKGDEIEKLEKEVGDLEEQIESPLADEITSIQTIRYEADNLQDQQTMETLKEAIEKHGSLNVMYHLQKM